MESFVLAGIGLAALGYVARVTWKALNGKSSCNCGETCSGKGCAAYSGFCKKK